MSSVFSNIAVVLLVVIGDQVSKYFALLYLSNAETVPVIDGVFNLVLVYNPGAAFGLFSQMPTLWRRLTLSVVSLAAMVVVGVLYRDAKSDRWARFALSAVLGGAIGNLIDRFRFDAVVDFLDFYYANYHWPAFNVADSAISVGVTLLVLRMVFAGGERTNPADKVLGDKLPTSGAPN